MKNLEFSKSTENFMIYKFISYNSLNRCFNLLCDDTIYVKNEEKASEIDNLIEELRPLILHSMHEVGFTNMNVDRIIRESIEPIDSYNCGIMVINPKNTSKKELALRLVQRCKKKYDEALEYCNKFLVELENNDVGKFYDYERLEKYEKNINYFELSGMLSKEEIQKKMGPSPLDKMIMKLDKIKEILNDIKEQEKK